MPSGGERREDALDDVARGRDAESERAAQEALLEIADGFSPRVEDAGGGVLYFDLDGVPGRHPMSRTSAIQRM